MGHVDEDVIVIAPDEPNGSGTVASSCQGCVEVIVEREAEDAAKPPKAPSATGPSAIDDLDDIEPMPAVQRVVLIVVCVLIALGIAALIAYWNGLLGG